MARMKSAYTVHMPENPTERRGSEPWEKLAQTYASSRQVSAGHLIEWRAAS